MAVWFGASGNSALLYLLNKKFPLEINEVDCQKKL